MVSRGYTIIEVMVVVMIFGILSAVVLANFHGNQGAQNLRAAANEVATHIREAQSLTQASAKQNLCTIDRALCGQGSLCDPTVTPPNCNMANVASYGVAFNVAGTNNKYAVFADTSMGGGCHAGCYNAGEALPGKLFTLPPGIVFQSVTQTTPPPSPPPVILMSNLVPFGSCTACVTSVVLKNNADNTTRTVSYREATGAVTVQQP